MKHMLNILNTIVAAGFAARVLPSGNIRVSIPSMTNEPVIGIIMMDENEPYLTNQSLTTNVSYTDQGTRVETSGMGMPEEGNTYQGITEIVKYFIDNFS